jgi:hypothetical protein
MDGDVEDEERTDIDFTTEEMIPSLPEENIFCEYLPETMVLNKGGIILQFFNIIPSGVALPIGMDRLKLTDIRKLPNYIAKYLDIIKEHAVYRFLALGTSKKLYKEDYAIAFSVASLSPAGRKSVPNGTNDGPLYFCASSGMTEAVKLSRDDTAHVINVIIYRNDVEQTVEEAEAATRKKQLQVNKNNYQLPLT